MTFVHDTTGQLAPSEVEKIFTSTYPYPDATTRDDWTGFVREHTAKVANRFHDAVSARVSAEPGLIALTDQFEAELLDTARRGRRG